MALASRDATVIWKGAVGSGHGELRTGALSGSTPMQWASRTEQADGTTSPEELLAAAQAGCYAMTLSLLLAREGHEPEALEVRAVCKLEQQSSTPEYRISAVEVEVRGTVPGVDDDAFEELCRRADEECAISAALRGDAPAELSVRVQRRQAA